MKGKTSVAEYIRDELEARGWDEVDLAERMGGDVELNHCALEIAMACIGSRHERIMHIDEDFANGLARAFGTSAKLWLNIDAAYHDNGASN